MHFKIILFICLLMASVSITAQSKTKPLPVIFDSDMGPDYDDVGALTLLHAFADSGYINILATVASTKYEGVAAVFNVLNTYFKRPDLPIGVPKNNALELKDFQHWTDTLLLKYPHKINSNNDAYDAVEIYRKMLASQPDGSVTIITVGFLTNLANLLRSTPDKYSKLDGKALVKKKVSQLVCMAGAFPSGSEFNVRMDAAASQYVFDNWETPVLFSGVEIGNKIKTGLPLVNNDAIKNSPVKDVYRICTKMSKEDADGRKSWDQSAVVAAVKCYKPWWKLEPGSIKLTIDGSNTWLKEKIGHNYLAEAIPPSVLENYINKLMMHQPVKK
jgi:pyrimidine-specific ribonucleoside hydrolase